MKKTALFSCLILAAAVGRLPAAWAQDEAGLHVSKTDIHAETDTPEFCLTFDRTLAPLTGQKLAAAVRLESGGKAVTPAHIAVVGASLCLSSFERSKPYHLTVNGVRGEGDERLATPYEATITVPDRSPLLTLSNGNNFGSYDKPLVLRAVNIKRAKVELYRLTANADLAAAWLDRAQTALAPTESAYLARSKGQWVWGGEVSFDGPKNVSVETKVVWGDKAPDLAAGLYLAIVEAAGDKAQKSDSKLAPLAAAWFTKADFSLHAVRDADSLHVMASRADGGGGKGNLRLFAFSRKPEVVGEGQVDGNGVGAIAFAAKAFGEVAGVFALDAAGGVAFADPEPLPVLASTPAPGVIHLDALVVGPGEDVSVTLALTTPESLTSPYQGSRLRLVRGDFVAAEVVVPAVRGEGATLTFPAPAASGAWVLHWVTAEGAELASAPLRVSARADAPKLVIDSGLDALGGDGVWPVTIRSLTASGKPTPLVGGQARIAWQKLEPATLGWKDYRFGTSGAIQDAPISVADFLTDLQGEAPLRLALPKPPPERGLYQAQLQIVAEGDSGVADAAAVTLPLRVDGTMVGIKPLAAGARFGQNGTARFALIALASDARPRDISGVSYQVYEEGRSFSWYQDEGRWQYKPAPTVRPIGGGPLTIKADGTSVLEWPVTAGNYRVEILDASGKVLARTAFSAGWDPSAGELPVAGALPVAAPKVVRAGQEAVVHVTLPAPSMVTAVISDTRVRKIIHEARDKGDQTIVFTPDATWPEKVALTVSAAPATGVGSILRASTELAIVQQAAEEKSAVKPAAVLAVSAADDPAALVLRKDGEASLAFSLENAGGAEGDWAYVVTASPGLRIVSAERGILSVEIGQSRMLAVSVVGEQVGVKDLRLELTKLGSGRVVTRQWPLAVLPVENALRSVETAAVAAKQALLPLDAKGQMEARVALVARLPMQGLAEVLSYVFEARPFTTRELALGVDALRLWGNTAARAGLAPDFVVAARRKEWLLRLLRRQNADGGFAALRGGDSLMEDTAAALTALGPDKTTLAVMARKQAVGWLKQRLANTWVDEKERAPRAAAFAALAAAEALDPASLHYYSDTSAGLSLPALAEVHMAAAFKQMRDPNAAAFWIKKMLDEHGGEKNAALLNALAATDALSADEARAAMATMAGALSKGDRPAFADAAGVLRAVATANADAGKWRLEGAVGAQDVDGVFVASSADAAAGYRNGEAQPLAVVFAAPTAMAQPAVDAAALSRHIYRLNGVELLPPAKAARGEIYMVEIKGNLPEVSGAARVLVQSGGGNGLRVLGCPLTAGSDILSFIPWFSAKDLTPVAACEASSHEVNAVLEAGERKEFSLVYFARADAADIGGGALPMVRVIGE